MTPSTTTEEQRRALLAAEQAIAEIDARREAELAAEGQSGGVPAPAIPAKASPRTARPRHYVTAVLAAVQRWFDTHAQAEHLASETEQKVDWVRSIPFVILHLVCFGVIWVGVSPVAVGVCAFMYVLRMFAITGFYHRYFSHRSFKTSRVGQFVFALLGASATQRGPLWWASHHRMHHKHSDGPEDVHSPKQHGFIWSHMGWITSKSNFPTQFEVVRDLMRFPELRFLDRFDTLVPILTGASMWLLGLVLNKLWPELGTSAPQMLIWGYFVSTVILAHATFTINSLSHLFGTRRYETKDTSRNNPLLALLTLGEGWHNNHHYYQSSARQGFYWWEYDLTYYGLKVLSWLGIVWDLRPVPREVREARPQRKPKS